MGTSEFYLKRHTYTLIFRVEYIQLASEYKPAVNLGQGFPDYPPPAHVTKALAEIATGENHLLNQYTRGFVSFIIILYSIFYTSFPKDSEMFRYFLRHSRQKSK